MGEGLTFLQYDTVIYKCGGLRSYLLWRHEAHRQQDIPKWLQGELPAGNFSEFLSWPEKKFHKRRGSPQILALQINSNRSGEGEGEGDHLFSHSSPPCFSSRKLVPNTPSKAAHFLAHDFFFTLASKPAPGSVRLECIYLVDPAFRMQAGNGPEHTPLMKELPQLSPLSTEPGHH